MRPSITTLVSGTIFKYFHRVIIGHSFLLLYTLSGANGQSEIDFTIIVRYHPVHGTPKTGVFPARLPGG